MAYDLFVTMQLAGDALGVDAATGFLVAGPYDTVKSPQPLFEANQRQDELADMITATSTTFLGLTVACARCHDHRFDPISPRDYFAMQAMLAGVRHGPTSTATSSTTSWPESASLQRKTPGAGVQRRAHSNGWISIQT